MRDEALDQVAEMRRRGVAFATIGKKLGIQLVAVYRLAAEAAERRLVEAGKTIAALKRAAEERDAEILRLEAQCAELRADLAEYEVTAMVSGVAKARAIVVATAEYHGLRFRDLVSENRTAHVVRARDEAAYRIAAETGMSQSAIGRLIGHRDHTSILAAIRRHARRAGLPTPRRISTSRQPKEQNHAQH